MRSHFYANSSTSFHFVVPLLMLCTKGRRKREKDKKKQTQKYRNQNEREKKETVHLRINGQKFAQ